MDFLRFICEPLSGWRTLILRQRVLMRLGLYALYAPSFLSVAAFHVSVFRAAGRAALRRSSPRGFSTFDDTRRLSNPAHKYRKRSGTRSERPQSPTEGVVSRDGRFSRSTQDPGRERIRRSRRSQHGEPVRNRKTRLRGCMRRVVTNRAATVRERFSSAKPDRFLTGALLSAGAALKKASQTRSKAGHRRLAPWSGGQAKRHLVLAGMRTGLAQKREPAERGRRVN